MNLKPFLRNFGADPIGSYKEELQSLCDKKQLQLQFLRNTDGRHRRVYFLIEGVSSAILGFLTRPKTTRENNNVAYNRISEADRIDLSQPDIKDNNENKVIKGLVLQIWENNKVVVGPIGGTDHRFSIP